MCVYTDISQEFVKESLNEQFIIFHQCYMIDEQLNQTDFKGENIQTDGIIIGFTGN
jgi:hypothetical protein